MVLGCLRRLRSSDLNLVLGSGSPRRKELFQRLLGERPFTILPSRFAEDLDPDAFDSPCEYVSQTALLKTQDVLTQIQTDYQHLCHKTDCLIVGADTIVVLQGNGDPSGDAGKSRMTILGKPNTADRARAMLTQLSGRTHTVLTAVCLFYRRASTSDKDGVAQDRESNPPPLLPSAVLSSHLTDADPHEVHRSVGEVPVDQPDGWKSLCFTESLIVTMSSLEPLDVEQYVVTGEPLDKAGGYGIQGLGGALVQSIQGDFYCGEGFPLNSFCSRVSTLIGR